MPRSDEDEDEDEDDDDSALLALIEGLSTTEVRALLAPTISAAVGANAGAIASIGVVTANRPEALLRALESYAEHARHHGRAPDLVVVDDSRAPAMRATNRGALAALSRARGAPVRYAGTEGKEAFLRALGAFDVPPDVARFALLPDATDTTTVGANRNALLLDAVGDLVFSSTGRSRRPRSSAPSSSSCAATRRFEPPSTWPLACRYPSSTRRPRRCSPSSISPRFRPPNEPPRPRGSPPTRGVAPSICAAICRCAPRCCGSTSARTCC